MTRTQIEILNELQSAGRVVIATAAGRGAKDGRISAGQRRYDAAVALVEGGLVNGYRTSDTESRNGRSITYRQIVLSAI